VAPSGGHKLGGGKIADLKRTMTNHWAGGSVYAAMICFDLDFLKTE